MTLMDAINHINQGNIYWDVSKNNCGYFLMKLPKIFWKDMIGIGLGGAVTSTAVQCSISKSLFWHENCCWQIVQW